MSTLATKLKIVKDFKGADNLIKASVTSSGKGYCKITNITQNGYYIHFIAHDDFKKLPPMSLIVHMMDLMVYTCNLMHEVDKRFKNYGVFCQLGSNLHKIWTPENVLSKVFKKTKGKIKNIDDDVFKYWKDNSKYTLTTNYKDESNEKCANHSSCAAVPASA